MKISIALASYNGAAYLPAQLASFASQTRLPDELVITDDGSTDTTEEVVRAFAATVPFPVRFERNPTNLGFGQNFNRAMSLCTGDLLMPSDQDDVWLDTKLAHMEAVARDNPAQACFMNDALLADGELKPNGKTKLGQIRAAGLSELTFVMGCCVTVRRSFLDLALPVPATMPSHDSWLVQMSDTLGLTKRIDTPLQLYRLHGRNVSKFFVNSVETPSLGDKVKQRLTTLRRRRTSDNIDRELMFMTAIAQRLGERPEAVAALVGPERAAEAKVALDRRVAVLSRRRTIRDLSLLARPGALGALWRDGGYAVSGGVKGLLKDALSARGREAPR